MQKSLTEPEKYIEALLNNDRIRRHEEETRRLLTEREGVLQGSKSRLTAS